MVAADRKPQLVAIARRFAAEFSESVTPRTSHDRFAGSDDRTVRKVVLAPDAVRRIAEANQLDAFEPSVLRADEEAARVRLRTSAALRADGNGHT
jgi:hypothetical protein